MCDRLTIKATSGFGYNGKYYNAASGMIYLRARFYAPEMNRFSQKDILRGSILQPVSLNRYLYVQNDPVNFVDPSGMRQVAGMYGDGTGRTSTTRSSSRTSYTPPSYPAPSGPARSTASSVNPYNTVRATSQAISDARRVADIANSQAPGSPAAYRATQAYYETQRLAAQAMASHNTQAGIKAVQTSQASVNYVNNVVTGRAPNTYSPYDSHGNVYSYYNSSYDTGKIPSPDAPRIEDIDADSVFYCGNTLKDATGLSLEQSSLESFLRFAGDIVLGASNSVGRNLIDAVEGIAKFAAPKRSYYIEDHANTWKGWLETNTRGLAGENTQYNIGQIVGDLGTVVLEYVGLIKAAKGIASATKGLPKLITSLGSLLPVGGPILETAATGSAATVGSEALILFGDILFNFSAFKEDIETLKEDMSQENESPESSKVGSNSDTGYYQRGKVEVPEDSELIRRDKANVNSEEFKDFIREEDGYFKSNEWKKYMETWETPDGEYIEVHYWKNTKTGEIWSHK